MEAYPPKRILGSASLRRIARTDVAVCAAANGAHVWPLGAQGQAEAAGRSQPLSCTILLQLHNLRYALDTDGSAASLRALEHLFSVDVAIADGDTDTSRV